MINVIPFNYQCIDALEEMPCQPRIFIRQLLSETVSTKWSDTVLPLMQLRSLSSCSGTAPSLQNSALGFSPFTNL